MSFIHDLVKLNLVRSGYLADMPYHLISDKEMCNAFISAKQHGDRWVVSADCYFGANYPCVSDTLVDAYNKLVGVIMYHIQAITQSRYSEHTLPDWVYSYMLGEVISVHSPKADIHDMLVATGIDNIDDNFTSDAAIKCLEISSNWMNKLAMPEKIISDVEHPDYMQPIRVPTVFGEPHVLKSLRLQSI